MTGMDQDVEALLVDMSTIELIHAEIDELSGRRGELWYRLSEGRDPGVAHELKDLDDRLAALWQAHRVERARIRFGEREHIVKRARAEERLERAA
jgi:PAS domain-containing protein